MSAVRLTDYGDEGRGEGGGGRGGGRGGQWSTHLINNDSEARRRNAELAAIGEGAKHGVGTAAVATIAAAWGNVYLVHHAVEALDVSIPGHHSHFADEGSRAFFRVGCS